MSVQPPTDLPASRLPQVDPSPPPIATTTPATAHNNGSHRNNFHHPSNSNHVSQRSARSACREICKHMCIFMRGSTFSIIVGMALLLVGIAIVIVTTQIGGGDIFLLGPFFIAAGAILILRGAITIFNERTNLQRPSREPRRVDRIHSRQEEAQALSVDNLVIPPSYSIAIHVDEEPARVALTQTSDKPTAIIIDQIPAKKPAKKSAKTPKKAVQPSLGTQVNVPRSSDVSSVDGNSEQGLLTASVSTIPPELSSASESGIDNSAVEAISIDETLADVPIFSTGDDDDYDDEERTLADDYVNVPPPVTQVLGQRIERSNSVIVCDSDSQTTFREISCGSKTFGRLSSVVEINSFKRRFAHKSTQTDASLEKAEVLPVEAPPTYQDATHLNE